MKTKFNCYASERCKENEKEIDKITIKENIKSKLKNSEIHKLNTFKFISDKNFQVVCPSKQTAPSFLHQRNNCLNPG